MNGFLVLLSCTMDDFPIFLTDNEDEAIRVAKEHDGIVPEPVQAMFDLDATELVCTKVVLFVQGKPIRVRIVKDFN